MSTPAPTDVPHVALTYRPAALYALITRQAELDGSMPSDAALHPDVRRAWRTHLTHPGAAYTTAVITLHETRFGTVTTLQPTRPGAELAADPVRTHPRPDRHALAHTLRWPPGADHRHSTATVTGHEVSYSTVQGLRLTPAVWHITRSHTDSARLEQLTTAATAHLLDAVRCALITFHGAPQMAPLLADLPRPGLLTALWSDHVQHASWSLLRDLGLHVDAATITHLGQRGADTILGHLRTDPDPDLGARLDTALAGALLHSDSA